MLVVDTPERVSVAATRRGASFRRRAELLQVDIADAVLVERRRELALGKAWPARRRDRAGIDQQFDLCALELAEHRGGLGLLVSDSEQRRRFRWISFSAGLSFQSFDQRHGGGRRA